MQVSKGMYYKKSKFILCDESVTPTQSFYYKDIDYIIIYLCDAYL